MLDSQARLDSHGDTLASYVVVPIGYGFLADNGFYLRLMAGAMIVRDRKDVLSSVPGAPPAYTHDIGAGPMLTASAGYAF